jgi:hypothetical protein
MNRFQDAMQWLAGEADLDRVVESHPSGRQAACRYVDALFGGVEEGTLVEVRFRAGQEMRRRFFDAARPDPVVDAALALASGTDVFLGILPRVRRRARREDILGEGRVAWADCDTPASSMALATFVPRPSMIVASGSGRHRHAYWLLREPVDLDMLEDLNRRLATALGADAGAVTRATAILRPPGTLNRKHCPPSAVRLVELHEDRRIDPGELGRTLPSEPVPTRPSRSSRPSRPGASEDPLLAVPPPVYFERLTGRRVGRSGKVRCPFHDDRTPSLHVYGDPARGWYCFGCGRGGSIYDLAALLWGRRTQGRDFVELRRDLRRRLG